MLNKVFNGFLNYFSGYDIHCEIKELEHKLERMHAIKGDEDTEDELRQLKRLGFNFKITACYLPNVFNAMTAGMALAESRFPYEALAMEGLRILSRWSTRSVIRARERELEKSV